MGATCTSSSSPKQCFGLQNGPICSLCTDCMSLWYDPAFTVSISLGKLAPAIVAAKFVAMSRLHLSQVDKKPNCLEEKFTGKHVQPNLGTCFTFQIFAAKRASSSRFRRQAMAKTCRGRLSAKLRSAALAWSTILSTWYFSDASKTWATSSSVPGGGSATGYMKRSIRSSVFPSSVASITGGLSAEWVSP